MARFIDSPVQTVSPSATVRPSVKPHFARGGSAPSSTARRANRYGAKCVTCGGWVNAEEGYLAKTADGRWAAEHILPCPDSDEAWSKRITDETREQFNVLQAAAVAKMTAALDAPPAPKVAPVFPIPDGRYTVSWDDQYKTLRVRTQDETSDFMPGRAIIQHLTGSNNDADYTSFAHVDETGSVRIWKKHQTNGLLREAVKILLDSPQKAAESYAVESGTCSRCGRTLTVPASLNAGLGPECAKMVSW